MTTVPAADYHPIMTSRLVLALCLAAVVATTGAAAPAHGSPEQDTLTLVVPLHQALVGVQGASTAPTVRVRDAQGQLLAEVIAGTRADDGTWLAELSAPSELTRRMLVTPGQTIEAVAGAITVTADVPELTALTDPAADSVSGLAPGFSALYLQLHWDTALYGEMEEPAGEAVLVGLDGRYSHSWAGRTDLEPGMWGDVFGTKDGHLFATQFAPPHALVYWDQPIVQVRADAGMALEAVSASPALDRVFRSPAYPYAGILHFVPLYDPNDPEAPPELLRAGDNFSLERAGSALFAQELPRITAAVDRPTRQALGSGPPDGMVRLRLGPAGDAQAPFSSPIQIAEDGFWYTRVAPDEASPDARVEALFYGEGALAHHVTGGALGMRTDLFGFRVQGVLLGRDKVRLRLTGAPDGAEGRAETAFDGAFFAELFDPAGDPAVVRPGRTLAAEPGWGPVEQHEVPLVTAGVVSERTALEGQAPPGSIVSARVYTTPLSVFLGAPYDLPFVPVEGTADLSGRYRLGCPSPCSAEYGTVTADTGSHQATLRWLSRPMSEADVPAGTIRGFATAGDQVHVKAGSESWAGGSVPSLGTDLPGWRAELGDGFADGFEPGTQLELAVGTSTFTATVPALTWSADTARNRVTGTGPPGMVVVIAAIPPVSDASREAAVVAALVMPSGSWVIEFPGFDLRGGDALELLIPFGDLLLRWYEPAVRGNDPATATPARASWSSFLPILHYR
jgi:hypothetical protein